RGGHRESERDEREVQPRQAQRRDREGDAGGARDRSGERDRPVVRDAVLRDEDRRRVPADRHERAVTERYLAGVAREDVQPRDRDQVDRDVGELERAELREREREQRDERERRREEEARPEPRADPHTRLTAACPNSPAGRTRSTARMTRRPPTSRMSPAK